jgi:hypothetical protein
MPAIQRGSTRKLPSGKQQLRYYDAEGNRHTGGVFTSKSAAMRHYATWSSRSSTAPSRASSSLS